MTDRPGVGQADQQNAAVMLIQWTNIARKCHFHIQ